ncbi:hypothetical protein AMTR_s00080p00155380 [Amborella trichopoda]|uniref:Uncharacterized protein n=1 Tax=Amborella trichopoda TaxID=13333 RepID=W1PB76_AMBTC|nr:hypothetical protein AMTR_s00080p00155380 [Amborella trichopoda]
MDGEEVDEFLEGDSLLEDTNEVEVLSSLASELVVPIEVNSLARVGSISGPSTLSCVDEATFAEALRSESELRELNGVRLTYVEETLTQHHGLREYVWGQSSCIARKSNLKARGVDRVPELTALREEIIRMSLRHCEEKGELIQCHQESQAENMKLSKLDAHIKKVDRSV